MTGQPTSTHRTPARQNVLGWSERQLQANVIDAAKHLGWSIYHTHDSRRSQPGFPDLVLWHPIQRRLILRELKTETGRMSPAQMTTIHGMQAAGADVAVWRPRDWAGQQIIDDLRGAPRA